MDLGIFDPQYVQKQQVASQQQMAAQQNALRVAAFNQACSDYIQSYGKAPVPTVPKKIVVDPVTGSWSEASFSELSVPSLPTPAATTGTLLPFGQPVDRIDQIIAILKVMNDKIDGLKK